MDKFIVVYVDGAEWDCRAIDKRGTDATQSFRMTLEADAMSANPGAVVTSQYEDE